MSRLWYFATPYTRYPGGPEDAYQDAAIEAARCYGHGIQVFCPITHSHRIDHVLRVGGMTDAPWLEWDEPFMRVCFGLIVCKMESWEISAGIAREIDTFRAMGKPIIYMEPGEPPVAECWLEEETARKREKAVDRRADPEFRDGKRPVKDGARPARPAPLLYDDVDYPWWTVAQ